jgi:aspartyl-tRNA(Asn)/glutamyl-tRNA(Gln) amidotransferase subunit A
MPKDPTATPTELHWLTIADAARLIEKRRLSPVELIDALLARIEALDPQLNAFLLPTPEKAREQAKAAEREITAARYRGPLHTVRPEGHLCNRRDPHDEPFENLREPRPD